MKGVCDVCRLVDGDYSEKEVQWCSFCNAYICSNDLYSPRRIRAWAKNKGITWDSIKSKIGL